MKLKSVKSIMILSKRAIVMGINDHFRKMSKKQLAIIYYGLLKSKLPRLRTIKRKALPWHARQMVPKRKTKRKKMTKTEKTKFLRRLNKGRIKAGLKPIRAKR